MASRGEKKIMLDGTKIHYVVTCLEMENVLWHKETC